MTMQRGARISDCGRYRYALLRRWGDGQFVTFVMLNPSTADAEVDDPTIRRCIGFAKTWGHARPERVATVLSLPCFAQNLQALGVTKSGAPKHPLYLPASAQPEPWPPVLP